MRKILVALLAAWFLQGVSPARAQTESAGSYPSRAIKIIVPFTPGGIVDLLGRLVAEKLTESWGQPVVLEHRPGAAGSVGAEAAARSPADGYTLLIGTVSSNAVNLSLYPNIRYKSADFEPLSPIASGPNLLVIHPSLPAQNLQEFIAVLKANPGKYNFGSTGIGSSVHLFGELFKLRTGTQTTHVPYRGSGPLMNDLVAGHIQFSFDNFPTALAQAKAGTLRALAVTSAERWPGLPDVPSVGEVVPGFAGTSWQGLFAPAGLPAPIAEKISARMREVMATPEIKKRLEDVGTRAVSGTRAEFSDFVQKEIVRWAEVVKVSGAKAE